MQTFMPFVLAVACFLGPEAGIVDLEPVVEHMEQAVLAGDAATFLHFVDATDGVFFQEQSNWAKDLRDHVPAAFDIQLDTSRIKVQADGSVTAPMTVAWRLERGSRRRRVRYTGRFVEHDGSWQYAGEQWLRVEAPGVVVMADPQYRDLALHIATILPDVRQHVETLLAVKVPHDQQVKVYADMRHLQESVYLSYVDALGGWNEPGESIKILGPEARTGSDLRELLAHEYGHCASFELGPKANQMPWWVLEGVAEYCSAEVAGGTWGDEKLVRLWARNNALCTWDQLADFRGEAMHHMENVYVQGHAMIRFIADEFGIGALRVWLLAMSGGDSLDEASRASLHLPWDEVDKKWRASIED